MWQALDSHFYSMATTHNNIIIIVGNFGGRTLSRIPWYESHLRKFSPQNTGHATPTYTIGLAFREDSLREILTSYRSAKVFSLETFPL